MQFINRMNPVKFLFSLAVAGIFSATLIIYSGIYTIGADVPHFKFVYWILEQTRDNSVAHASKNIQVPALDDPDMLLAGGQDYNYMCAMCHLKPGQKESDLSVGLYPSPPNLSAREHNENHQSDSEKSQAQKMFWTIKHGIKASGMPAWGKTHDDKRIWAMVAFLKRLPELTPDQYQILTAVD